MSGLVWLVTDTIIRRDEFTCTAANTWRDSARTTTDWREATAEELASIPRCEHRVRRAAKSVEEWGLRAQSSRAEGKTSGPISVQEVGPVRAVLRRVV